MDWAAWGPTIVSVMTAIFIAGGMYSTQREHSQKLKNHDILHDQTAKHDAAQDVALAKLESWKDGYAAARSTYEKHHV